MERDIGREGISTEYIHLEFHITIAYNSNTNTGS